MPYCKTRRAIVDLVFLTAAAFSLGYYFGKVNNQCPKDIVHLIDQAVQEMAKKVAGVCHGK